MPRSQANELFVRPDERLARDVQEALRADHSLDSSRVRVSPAGSNRVVLSGEVPSESQRAAAAQLAGRIPGVKEVIEQLRVGTRPAKEDVLLQARIAEQIDDDPLLRAEDVVEVRVTRGIADLGGIVDTWNKHHQATHDAFLSGAKKVVNHLRVRNDPARSEQNYVYKKDPLLEGSRNSG